MRIHLFYMAVLIGLSALCFYFYKNGEQSEVLNQSLSTLEFDAAKLNQYYEYTNAVQAKKSASIFKSEYMLRLIHQQNDQLKKFGEVLNSSQKANKDDIFNNNERIITALETYRKVNLVIIDSLIQINAFQKEEKINVLKDLHIATELYTDSLRKKLNCDRFFARRLRLQILHNEALLDAIVISRLVYMHFGDADFGVPGIYIISTPIRQKVKKGEIFTTFISTKSHHEFREEETVFNINGQTYKPKNNVLIWTERADKTGIHTYKITVQAHSYMEDSVYEVSQEYSYEVVP